MATKTKSNGKTKVAPRFAAEDLEATAEKGDGLRLTITPLREKIAVFEIKGTAPLLMGKFSAAKFDIMKETQEAGQQAKSKKVRKPRDFEKDFEAAAHKSRDGWFGLPCAAFRRGLVDTCKTVGFKMTIAKMSVFIESDGYDHTSGDPLVRIDACKPVMDLRPARNANGSCDIRSRPRFDEWSAKVRIRFDEDQFSMLDVLNLLNRMGAQNGIGEGRANSKQSCGIGFGSFKVVVEDE